jgi:hypothetical protein
MTDSPTPEKLSVGQKLWFVPSGRRGDPKEVTILKIGRKYADIGNGSRVDVKTLHVDGRNYSSPGTCFLSRDAHETEVATAKAWDELKQLFNRTWIRPKGVTLSQIQNARRSLFKETGDGK